MAATTVRVGFVKPNGTVITADMPAYYQNIPQEIPVLHNITKADYKTPIPDYWFWCWDTNAGGDNCLCRARLLPNNTIQVDVIRINLPLPGLITQITADYLTANAVGGHVFVGFDFGQLGFFGAFKFTITQDNPLTIALSIFLFGRDGFPSAMRVGGIALNTTHTRLTVLYNSPNDGRLYACVVDTATFAQVAGSPVILGTIQGITNQGFRLETDVWAASPNFGWQVFTANYPGTGYAIFAFEPNLMQANAGSGYQANPGDYNHSFRDGGELCLIYIPNNLALTHYQYRHTPVGGAPFYSAGIIEAHAFAAVATYDVNKIGQRRYYGTWSPQPGAINTELRRWTSAAPLVDIVSYGTPGTSCYAVACVREGYVIP